MNTTHLRKNIIALSHLPKSDEPVISAYFNMQQPLTNLLEEFGAWARATRKTFETPNQLHFDLAAANIYDWLENKAGKCRSAAVFARNGEIPFMMPLAFKVPMETFFQVDTLPAIYPLVEIKDRFNRFVVVLTSQDSARIIEMNLGETSAEMLAERPEIKERHGREWTREHYLSHSRDRDKKFVKEKVAIIEQLLDKRGHNALIIVGEPRYVNRLQEALPKNLREKVVDQIRTGVSDKRLRDILENAIESYLQVENNESEDAVKKLFRASQTSGLAIFGAALTKEALQIGQADQLVISSSLGHQEREVLVRLASQNNIPIETVRDSALLEEQGGVGALLRYSPGPTKLNTHQLVA